MESSSGDVPGYVEVYYSECEGMQTMVLIGDKR